MTEVLGLDVGGANLKATHTAGRAISRRFSLWKAPERLSDELRRLIGGSPAFDHLAVTMTGELCDCFQSKRHGVNHILDAVTAVAGSIPVSVWTNEGTFTSLEQARQQPLRVASANWLALATAAGRLAPSGPALLIDCGTTTTDVIPLFDGRPVPVGRTDQERLQSGELVYMGWRRTPLCAFLEKTHAAELFATAMDVYLVLGAMDEDLNDRDTADGGPATREAAHRRLARVLCGDLETTTPKQRRDLALEMNVKVVSRIALAVNEVSERLAAPPRAVVASGSGEFLVPSMLPAPLKDCPIISLRDALGSAGSAAACAAAVAALLKETLPS